MPGIASSTSRRWRRSRSRSGAWRLVPAPAGVPVERLVGNGLVRPWTLRPVSGVCARVRSRPLPPRAAAFFAAGRLLAGEVFLAAEPEAFEVFAGRLRPPALARAVDVDREAEERGLAAGRRLAVFRAFGAVRRAGAFFRAAVFVRRPDAFAFTVFRVTELFRAAPAVLRDAAFLAMVTDPRW